MYSILRSAGADVALLQECEDLLVNTLVPLHFKTQAPDLHLQHVAKMTQLTRLAIRTMRPWTRGHVATRSLSFRVL